MGRAESAWDHGLGISDCEYVDYWCDPKPSRVPPAEPSSTAVPPWDQGCGTMTSNSLI